jgi:hypothetical protein
MLTPDQPIPGQPTPHEAEQVRQDPATGRVAVRLNLGPYGGALEPHWVLAYAPDGQLTVEVFEDDQVAEWAPMMPGEPVTDASWSSIAPLVAEMTRTEIVPLTEHALLMAGGGMHVRKPHPVLDEMYPLADWIKQEQGNGARVYRRRVLVVEDWQEVSRVQTD